MDNNFSISFKTTDDIKIPPKIVDQVIGQEAAVEIIKKAAIQRRNVLLVGAPGTGKSMLGQALSQLLPAEKLVDILAFPNPKDENEPTIKTVPAGEGKRIVNQAKARNMSALGGGNNMIVFLGFIVAFFIATYVVSILVSDQRNPILAAANQISGTLFIITMLIGFLFVLLMYRLGRTSLKANVPAPKLLLDNSSAKYAPFIDATGAKEGALLGDVQHDPFQSGGLGTPAHERVVLGDIHKANGGVLFIDEIANLSPETQIQLLTAMQEKKLSITGRSERSAGAMVKTNPVPCDFILVGAGNPNTLSEMSPALRSRIRGYGYEIYMNETMPDTIENRDKIARFVAQEISKDTKIPPFSRDAVVEILNEARRKSNRKESLTLKLRELGGVIRVAGDIAVENKHSIVNRDDVLKAKNYAGSFEQQIAARYIKEKKDYDVIQVSGSRVGRVNGLAVIENSDSGLMLPIEAIVTKSMRKGSGEIIATGKLGEIAQEAVKNVSAIVKLYANKPLTDYDIHIQFLQAYSGVEGDSASVSVAVSILSALTNIPIKQSVAMTGSLSIWGEVLPVGGVSAKVEAAINAGIKEVIIPASNVDDLVLSDPKVVKITPADSIIDVIEHAMVDNAQKKKLLNTIKKSLKIKHDKK
ncbi:MAG: ATP-dependent protease LonB [Candidatus Parvarchaeota archaeon]|nr:ATP-dependent protease LonB [Candidatus Parvarchaeota archaeon]MCW1294651.1 ATP-dependent protease LonB [Candidatus Parvarchaeum tengchongense]MCW1295104.1 ATP-dependent protease LonB [Candidatus Parvarchaeum tengchongense]MCW1312231.1 ATP-dependent protease LonB [Candidatus Parvarchaeum tengchongense]